MGRPWSQLRSSTRAAFVCYAIVAGPVQTFTSRLLQYQSQRQRAAALALAGCVICCFAAMRGDRIRQRDAWMGVLALAAPSTIVSLIQRYEVLPHATSWGVAFLISLAAPLWLALLSAMGAIDIEVPRLAAGAAIAGIGAALLTMVIYSYAVGPGQIPALLLDLAYGIAVVYSWWFGQKRLSGQPVMLCAGVYLVMGAALQVTMGGHDAGFQAFGSWWLVALQAGLFAGMYALWFFLLMRMELSAFSIHPLAVWTAGMIAGIPLILFASWRYDAAAAIGLAAVAYGVRASAVKEQPTALGLER